MVPSCKVLLLSSAVLSVLHSAQPQETAADTTHTALLNASSIPEGTSTQYITHGGRSREFIVHRPSGVGEGSPAALVLVFHGWTQTASAMCNTAGVASLAEARRFIGVCPQGVSNSFNAGGCCGTAQSQGVDDVGFSRAIVDHVAGGSAIDRQRVYATGFSNGGMMSYRLICQASDVFMGAASMAGSYWGTGSVLPFFGCSPTHARPVAAFHGFVDPVVTYAQSNAAYIGYVRQVQSCPSTSRLVYSNLAYFGMQCYERSPCAGGSASVWCLYSMLGHFYPMNSLLRAWTYFTTGRLTGSLADELRTANSTAWIQARNASSGGDL